MHFSVCPAIPSSHIFFNPLHMQRGPTEELYFWSMSKKKHKSLPTSHDTIEHKRLARSSKENQMRILKYIANFPFGLSMLIPTS